uniref:Uncharacterized protein n=1 Tax=Cacopsylla melanoneura TaxID=428564 RepID=A0A8D8XKE2_9HEMI
MDLKKQARVLQEGRVRYFERINRCFRLIEEKRDDDFLVMIRMCDDGFEKFESCTDELMKVNAHLGVDEDLETGNAQFETCYFSIKRHEEKLKKQEAAIAVSNNTNNSSNVTREVSVKLPVVNVPTFGGDILQFPSWKALYDELIHSNDQISDIQKFSYLKSYLVDHAKTCVDTIQFSAANYKLAYQALVERFSKRRILARTLVNKLLQFERLKNDSVEGLQGFLDHYNVSVQSLKGLRVINLGDFILTHMALCSLDEKTTLEFESKFSGTEFPTFETLVSFVKEKCLILEENMESVGSSISKNSNVNSAIPMRGHKGEFTPRHNGNDFPRQHNVGMHQMHHRKSLVTTTEPNRGVVGYLCPMCTTNDHKLAHCQRFLRMEPGNRFNAVKDMNLCFSCFSYSHNSSGCNSKYTCKYCASTKHHTTLCTGTAGNQSHSSNNQFRYGNNKQPNSANNVHNSRAEALIPGTSRSGFQNPIRNVNCAQDVSPNTNTQVSSVPTHFSGTSTTSVQGNVDSVESVSTSSVSMVLLGTAVVRVKDYLGDWHNIRAIIDSGSQLTVVSQHLSQLLRIPVATCKVQISGIGSEIPMMSKGKISFEMLPHSGVCDSKEVPMDIEAVVLPQITGNLTSKVPTTVLSKFRHLQLADTSFLDNAPNTSSKIDLLLGAEYYAFLCVSAMTIIPGNPSAIPSRLGWVLMGRVDDNSGNQVNNSTSLFVSASENISDKIQKFWEIEETVCNSTKLSPEEDMCEKHFVDTVSRDSTGRYVVRLPFRENNEVELGYNRGIAKQWLLSLEKRLIKNPELNELYKENLDSYLSEGHMEVTRKQVPYLLVHHGVFRESSLTTRLRVVFNPNIKSSTGKSLARELLVGTKLQLNIADLMVGFRVGPVALTCDIKGMFRAILLHKDDRKYQHILWRSDSSQSIQEYELKTLTFGLPNSPFSAQRVIKQLVSDEGSRFPMAADVLENSIYVDDILCSVSDVESAGKLRDELISLLAAGKFALRKWTSSHPEVLGNLPVEDLEKPHTRIWSEDESVKVLGLQWCPSSDSFSYSISVNNNNNVKPITKRQVLSVIASIYDVNGFISPVTVYLKIFMQKLWIDKDLSWDSTLSEELQVIWTRIMSQLEDIKKINIPRYFLCENYKSVSMVGFADASGKAYAAVIYLRILDANDEVKIHLIRSKTKVSPLKVQTIPKLELCAASLLVKVLDSLSFLHTRIKIDNTYLFSDSSIVLAWLNTQPHVLKTFVANRVVKILETTTPNQWRHVSSENNSADIASRGVLPSELVGNKLWFNGPSFLYEDPSLWPQASIVTSRESVPELKIGTGSNVLVCEETEHVKHELIKFIKSFSCIDRLERVLAWVLRFCNNIGKGTEKKTQKFLSISELKSSRLICVKASQEEHYGKEIKMIKGKKFVHSLRTLSPFVDSTGILRVGGRLRNAPLPEEAKYPILISNKCHWVKLLIEHFHKVTIHGGPALVQSLIQRMFWIVGARSLIRKVIFKCISCFRANAKFVQPYMADLPKSRFAQGRAFINVCVDLGGPLTLKTGPRRNSPLAKAWFCIFVCMSTTAVHIELVSSLSTEAFLACLDRFVGRRGLPSLIQSDNGTNLRASARYIKEVQNFLVQSEVSIASHLRQKEVEWRFVPSIAPWFNALAESGIRLAKKHLQHVLKDRPFNFEEVSTIFVSIEAAMNSKPICRLDTTPSEGMDVLTPGHFLIGAPLLARPEYDFTDTLISPLKRWALLTQASQCFFKRWVKDYLNLLIQRSKWHSQSVNLKVNDLVLIQGVQLPNHKWPLGVVVETFPGDDGVVRAVTVRTAKGLLGRPAAKLALMPVGEE